MLMLRLWSQSTKYLKSETSRSSSVTNLHCCEIISADIQFHIPSVQALTNAPQEAQCLHLLSFDINQNTTLLDVSKAGRIQAGTQNEEKSLTRD